MCCFVNYLGVEERGGSAVFSFISLTVIHLHAVFSFISVSHHLLLYIYTIKQSTGPYRVFLDEAGPGG